MPLGAPRPGTDGPGQGRAGRGCAGPLSSGRSRFLALPRREPAALSPPKRARSDPTGRKAGATGGAPTRVVSRWGPALSTRGACVPRTPAGAGSGRRERAPAGPARRRQGSGSRRGNRSRRLRAAPGSQSRPARAPRARGPRLALGPSGVQLRAAARWRPASPGGQGAWAEPPGPGTGPSARRLESQELESAPNSTAAQGPKGRAPLPCLAPVPAPAPALAPARPAAGTGRHRAPGSAAPCAAPALRRASARAAGRERGPAVGGSGPRPSAALRATRRSSVPGPRPGTAGKPCPVSGPEEARLRRARFPVPRPNREQAGSGEEGEIYCVGFAAGNDPVSPGRLRLRRGNGNRPRRGTVSTGAAASARDLQPVNAFRRCGGTRGNEGTDRAGKRRSRRPVTTREGRPGRPRAAPVPGHSPARRARPAPRRLASAPIRALRGGRILITTEFPTRDPPPDTWRARCPRRGGLCAFRAAGGRGGPPRGSGTPRPAAPVC